MTVLQRLDKAKSDGMISPRAYRLFIKFRLFKPFLNLDSRSFFKLFDYYDVFFIGGMGSKSFSQLQVIFPRLKRRFSISADKKLKALDRLDN